MTSLLVLKEQLKNFYARYDVYIRPVIKFAYAMCTFLCLNQNIGYMAKLKTPLAPIVLSLVCAVLPYGMVTFLAGCLMLAHIYTVSPEMALIVLVFMVVIVILYYGFKPGDSYLLVLTPLMFLFRVPYVVPLLVGLGGSVLSVIPVCCGIFLYYLLMYVKQNAGVLTSDASVDIIQKYGQIMKSLVSNELMMVMMAAFALGILVVYLIHRLSVNYAWVIAIIAGIVVQLLVIFLGDFLFSVSVETVGLFIGMAIAALISFAYNFFVFSVDYSRTEYAQFEDDDYYYYVKAVPKMNISTPDVRVQRINARKRSASSRRLDERG